MHAGYTLFKACPLVQLARIYSPPSSYLVSAIKNSRSDSDTRAREAGLGKHREYELGTHQQQRKQDLLFILSLLQDCLCLGYDAHTPPMSFSLGSSKTTPIPLILTFAKFDMSQSGPRDKRSLGSGASSVENRRHQQQPTGSRVSSHTCIVYRCTSSPSLSTTPPPNG
jgi:hypothetical protein